MTDTSELIERLRAVAPTAEELLEGKPPNYAALVCMVAAAAALEQMGEELRLLQAVEEAARSVIALQQVLLEGSALDALAAALESISSYRKASKP